MFDKLSAGLLLPGDRLTAHRYQRQARLLVAMDALRFSFFVVYSYENRTVAVDSQLADVCAKQGFLSPLIALFACLLTGGQELGPNASRAESDLKRRRPPLPFLTLRHTSALSTA